MFRSTTYRIAILAFLIIALAGCGRGNNQSTDSATNDSATSTDAAAGGEAEAATGVRADGIFRIVATTTQAADLAKILTEGVDAVEISGLMGAGVDPHLYQPTESDIAAMNAADMVLYSGLHLEGQFDAVFEALNEQGVRTYAMGQAVKDAGFIIGGFTLSAELTNVDDPHFWFDPRNWELTTQEVAVSLGEQDPEFADVYTANAEAYVEQLGVLYAWANSGMITVPEEQRYLVTSHDAFQYFGSAFGWQMAAIQGMSTQDEAGVGDIQGIVDFVRDNNIPVLFVESSIPPNTIEAVIEAARNDGQSVREGVRPMYSDAMGEPGTFGGTYIGMLAENVYTVLQSYSCEGVALTIADWPEGLSPTPPEDLLAVDCAE